MGVSFVSFIKYKLSFCQSSLEKHEETTRGSCSCSNSGRGDGVSTRRIPARLSDWRGRSAGSKLRREEVSRPRPICRATISIESTGGRPVRPKRGFYRNSRNKLKEPGTPNMRVTHLSAGEYG